MFRNEARRRKTRTVDEDVLKKVEYLVWVKGETNAAEVYRQVKETFGEVRAKSPRTIFDIVQELKPPRPEEPWLSINADPDDAAIVLPVLASVIEATGHLLTFTNAVADWVVRIRKLAPDLPPYAVFELAAFYFGRQERGMGTHDLDLLVGFAPWRGPQARERWLSTLRELQVPAGAAIPWLEADDYGAMLERLGYSRPAIEESGGNYERLRELQDQMDRKGEFQ